ncbi:hypothetical protein KDL01_11055 [Actinospica durhamensis]|uniref:Integral membrane protein n=1 Tax=Actinospica durhamensis TaxID=1508375 RepID=A0A941ELF2_9ACTN|nr:hypothetical protein [Actinospica durhamensis]MBR7833807.1 hypothetical protein [Actinospica durhamensis]
MANAEQPTRSRRTDYAGAVYGSMLAASVAATAGAGGGDLSAARMAGILIVTGVVFWAAHVYADLSGERQLDAERGQTWSFEEISRVARHEWGLVEAAVLPAVAVMAASALGLGLLGYAWVGLIVAVAQQVTWACVGAVRAGVKPLQVVIEGLINVLLGLIIVEAKVAVGH